jgi:hypothetical protein
MYQDDDGICGYSFLSADRDLLICGIIRKGFHNSVTLDAKNTGNGCL